MYHCTACSKLEHVRLTPTTPAFWFNFGNDLVRAPLRGGASVNAPAKERSLSENAHGVRRNGLPASSRGTPTPTPDILRVFASSCFVLCFLRAFFVCFIVLVGCVLLICVLFR